jgi:hypothetical protein
MIGNGRCLRVGLTFVAVCQDGMVLKSVFADGESEPGSSGPTMIRTGGLSPLARVHTHAHGPHHATLRKFHPTCTVDSPVWAKPSLLLLELSKRDRDQLRQKYANAKTNFSVVVVSTE